MSIGHSIQRWRLKRGLSSSELEQKAGLSSGSLPSLEGDRLDPPASMMASIAGVFGIPAPWLYGDPDHFDSLTRDLSETSDDMYSALKGSIDPVTEHILRVHPAGRNLFHLLSVLIQNGEEKHLRVVEINLRSLIKQTRVSLTPWENRQTGNFEPPSD